jgi:hypothetical protein
MAIYSPALYTASNANRVSQGSPWSSTWLRFTGITIPQNSTINSATLKIYCMNIFGGGTNTITIQQDARQTPGNPTSAPKVINPTTILTLTATADVPYWTTAFTSPALIKANYQLSSIDVTAMVQALVNSYGYSSGEMVFYAQSYPPNSSANIYDKNWGTSKDPELVVNFTPASTAPPDKTTYHHG